MCVSCGCGQFENDHGDRRNITMKDLQNAAQAANIDPQQVSKNIQQAAGQMGSR